MTVSGLEMCTTETLSASMSFFVTWSRWRASWRRRGVNNSAVSAERNCTTKAVDDALMILAITWITPGDVSCRLVVVMSTSSGTLMRSAVNTLVAQAIALLFEISKRRAGNIVMFIVTVA